MSLSATLTSEFTGTLFAPEIVAEGGFARRRRLLPRPIMRRIAVPPAPPHILPPPYPFEEDAERWDGLA